MRHLARVAFFLSGVAGLTFEIVWFRYLGLSLGGTTLAVATTTAAYMGGLAVGSHFGGRIADALRRPLSAYGLLEIGVALVGLGIPALCMQVGLVDGMLVGDADSGTLRALVRFFVAAALLIVPTTAMGMTLPILSRVVTTHIREVGREVGLLYALNIAGAVAGAALSGFVWLPTLGLWNTNLIAVGIDLVLGLAAAAAGWWLTAETGAGGETDEATPVLRPATRRLVWVLAATGASAMSLQVLWTRALGTALGPSTYAFSAIVCTYLTGLAVGGAVASRIADRVVAVRAALAATLTLTGFLAFCGIAVIDDLPLLLKSVVLDESLTIHGLMRAQFGLAALSILPATLAMGAIFPLTVAAIVGSHRRLGAAVGRAYAINTVGAIAGSFAAAFILLPLCGVEWGMRISAVSYPLLAVWLTFTPDPKLDRSRRIRLQTAIAAATVVILAWPGWSVGHWTLGSYRLSMAREWFEPDAAPLISPIIFHEDGLIATVTVEQDDGARWIKVDGKIDGSSRGDMPTQTLSGLLPLAFVDAPEQVLVIGCGSCVTIGSVLDDPRIEAATLVEIEPAVLRAAPLFADVNREPWKDPRYRAVIDDGRNYLLRTQRTYDVIISEPSNPWMTGASSLFTVEFFEIARRRLARDGVFLQWLQVYELAPDRIETMLKTFQEVFPHVLVFTPHVDSNDLLMLGSATPLTLDWPRLEDFFQRHEQLLAGADLYAPEELTALLLLSDRQIAALERPLNTDDNALIAFGAPRDLVTFANDDPDLTIFEQQEGKRAALVGATLDAQRARSSEHFALIGHGYLKQGLLNDAVGAVDHARTLNGTSLPEDCAQVEAIARLLGDEEDAEDVIDPAARRTDRIYDRAASLVGAGLDEQALALLEENRVNLAQNPPHALLLGYLLYSRGRNLAARHALNQAAKNDVFRASNPAIAYYLGKEAFREGEYARAAEHMKAYHVSRQPLSGSGGGE